MLPIVSERTPTRKERKKVHPMVKEPTIAEETNRKFSLLHIYVGYSSE